MSTIRRAAVVGGGVIGGGWAARLLQNGIDVALFDPAPDAERKLTEILANAEHARARLFPGSVRKPGTLAFAATLEDAVAEAGIIIESVPERLEIKRSVHAAIDAAAPLDALVTSSTSGIRPSAIQAGLDGAGRILVAHPFNPVYLLPLVEICGGQETEDAALDRADVLFRSIGMNPLRLRQEIDGFLADRLMEALWREALWLVHDGVATTEEVDDAIRYGAGLRWAMMGTFQTFWLAGGEGGMRAMLEQFGPCLQSPWTKLTDVPELTDAFIERIATQCDDQADGRTPRELERLRDDGLVRIMQALEALDWGAGRTVAGYRRALAADAEKAGTT